MNKPRVIKRGYRKERYSAEFKQRAVDLVKELGSVKKAADQLDLHPPTVYSWVYVVEHGGVLEPSKGWVPENGDRYLNPNPGHGSDTPGGRRPDLGPRINPIYEQRGQQMESANNLAIGSSTVGGPGQADPFDYYIRKETAAQQDSMLGQVPASENYARVKRLEAENEALRQIIRGYQSLLNLI